MMCKQVTKRIGLFKIPEITTRMQSKPICAIFGVLTLVAILTIAPHAFAETPAPIPPPSTPPTPPPMEMGQNGYCPQSVDQKYCHKVIIIGAGMAGLGAANELKSHGYDYIILEAFPKAGGRVNTLFYSPDNVTKIPYDTHASLISGTVGNPITELADLYNVTHHLTNYSNANYYDNNGKINDAKRIANLNNTTLYSTFKTNFLTQYRQNKADEPLNIAIGKYNDTLSGTTNKTDFSYEIATAIGTEYAIDPDGLSLKYWDKIGYKVGGDNAVDSTFPNGFSQIIYGLRESLGNDTIQNKTIQYNTSATNVTYNTQGVSVTTNQGTTYYGKYVISTIPIYYLLKNPGIQFTPSLPDDKTYAINNMTNGTLSQTYLYFKNGVFWDNVQWIYYVPPFNETGHWTTFQNMYPVTGASMLLAENYGRFANQVIWKENPNQLEKDVVRVLDHMYHINISTKDIVVVYRGESTSYSSVPVNFTVPGDFDMLASPVPDDKGVDRVFFAGEATTWHYPQTTHGAYLTGLREANRVMITDTGKYPSPYWQEKNWRYPIDPTGKNHWLAFPEYIICKPPLKLALENIASPICVTNDTAQKLFQRGVIIDPSKADPTSPN